MEGVLTLSRGSVIMVSLFLITHGAKEKRERGERERGRKREDERERRGEQDGERGKKINLTKCDITYIPFVWCFSKAFQLVRGERWGEKDGE